MASQTDKPPPQLLNCFEQEKIHCHRLLEVIGNACYTSQILQEDEEKVFFLLFKTNQQPRTSFVCLFVCEVTDVMHRSPPHLLYKSSTEES